MNCPYCLSIATKQQRKKTSLGYRTFCCSDCRRIFNERTATPFNYVAYPTDIVLLVVVYRLRYKLSLRDVAEMFLERGFEFTHETVRDWEARFAPLIADQLRMKRRGQVGVSWHVDETYVKVQGKWCYLYRAIDGDGNLVDSMLSEKRNMDAAKRFSSKCSKRLVTHQSESQPMGINLIHVRSGRYWAVMLCTGPTTISTIDWNKIIVASNSATTQCVALELFHLPHAFVEPSMKCVSSFGSVPS